MKQARRSTAGEGCSDFGYRLFTVNDQESIGSTGSRRDVQSNQFRC